MKEYYTLCIKETAQETEDKLNELAEEGWKLVCSYAWAGHYLIMEREKKEVKLNTKDKLINKIIEIVRDEDNDEDDIVSELKKLKTKNGEGK